MGVKRVYASVDGTHLTTVSVLNIRDLRKQGHFKTSKINFRPGGEQ